MAVISRGIYNEISVRIFSEGTNLKVSDLICDMEKCKDIKKRIAEQNEKMGLFPS